MTHTPPGMGTKWNENVSYMSSANSETAMDEAADPDLFVLDRPMVAEPR